MERQNDRTRLRKAKAAKQYFEMVLNFRYKKNMDTEYCKLELEIAEYTIRKLGGEINDKATKSSVEGT